MSNQVKLLIISIILLIAGAVLTGVGINQIRLSTSKQPQNTQTEISPSPAPSQSGESSSSGILGAQTQKAEVVRVVDGDTFEIEDGKKVRLIGVDTPETVDPRRPVGCFGKEASDFSKNLLTGKQVVLEKDISETDKFGRLLRYVYLEKNGNLIMVNELLVKEGYARVSTYPPDVKYQEKFLHSEREARDNGKGLWRKCAT